MQWLAEKIDWHVSPSLPSTGLYVRMYPNGYENTFIFPRNRFEDANYEEPRFRYFLIFDMPEFLPATIDGGFGKRQLIMTFNGQPVHAANIEIFFPATATNHPFCLVIKVLVIHLTKEITLTLFSEDHCGQRNHPTGFTITGWWHIEDALIYDLLLMFLEGGMKMGSHMYMLAMMPI
jgi:hypothetical protein